MSQMLIKEYLQKNGPSSSSEIKKHLLSKGLSEQASRKSISRKGKGINTFTTFTLPKKEAFLYLDKQYNTPLFWGNFINSHIKKKSAYGIAISSLQNRSGLCPVSHFIAYSGSPLLYRDKKLSHDFIIEKLSAAKIIQLIDSIELGPCISFTPATEMKVSDISKKYAEIFTEELMIDALAEWFKNIGMASYNAISKRSEKNHKKFGAYVWDITSPSYALPLRSFNTEAIQPGFIVADVFNGELDVNGIRYFINKCQSMSALKNTKPFLPFLMANHFSKEAYNLGRSEGFILTTPSILFGEEVSKAFLDLTNTLANTASIAVENPSKMIEVFKVLKRIEGVENNLKGPLFEMISAHIINKSEGSYVDIGRIVKEPNGNKAEIDIFAVNGSHSIKIIECKAKLPHILINKSETEKWLSDRIKIIYNWIKANENYSNMNLTFEYWTTSDYTEDSLKLINNHFPKKYKIEFKNGKQILEKAQKAKLTTIVDTLNEHFLKHPLNKMK